MIAGFSLMIIGQAHAENWVDTKHVTFVDIDSIRQNPDGLVYYREKDKYGDDHKPRTGAYDCKKRLAFSSYGMNLPDWRSKGQTILPGTMGEELFNFVCSRVK